MGEVREVVDAVLYLESAAFVTGEVLHVDGGAARRPLVKSRALPVPVTCHSDRRAPEASEDRIAV